MSEAPDLARGGILPGNVDRPLSTEKEPGWRAVQSPLLVGALVFATFNLYAFWWLGRTWWQIKQEDSDSGKHPVWHALAMVVPIYGYFRFHAHMRAIVRLAATPGARASLSPGAMTIAWIVINVLDGTASQPASPVWVSILASGLGGALFGYAQSGLNATWHSLPGPHRRAGAHPLHWVLIVGGCLLYLLAALGTIVSESP